MTMNLRSRLMRILGKDKPDAVVWPAFLITFGWLEVCRDVLRAGPYPADARFGAVQVLLAVLWLGWLVGYAKALKWLPVFAAISAVIVLAYAALDRMGLSWLPMVIGVPLLIFSAIFCILALFDLIEARLS